MGMQLFTSLAVTAPAVLAPMIALSLGISPKVIGVFATAIYVGSMAGSLLCGRMIHRYGSIGISQAGIVCVAVGVVPMCSPGWLAWLSPFVIGFGYGPLTPAASHLLARTVPRKHISLMLSIKQTGVPLGTALAGVILPTMAAALNWRSALYLVACTGLAVATVVNPARRVLGDSGSSARARQTEATGAGFAFLAKNPQLAELALLGFVYAGTQMGALSYLVVYLVEARGLSLVSAGFALSVAGFAGILGRVLWGAAADALFAPRRVLATLGAGAGTFSIIIATIGDLTSMPTLLLLCVGLGITAVGWNGVYLAAIVRHVPENQVGPVTATISIVTFAGVASGPAGFYLIVAITENYAAGFVLFGIASLACGIWLHVRSNPSRHVGMN